MGIGHDPIRHLRYLRQSLSQDTGSVGFFLSAGCPLSVPMEAHAWPLIPDVARLTKEINQELSEDANFSLLLTELQKAQKNIENIEDTLSFLRGMLAVAKGGAVRGLDEKDLIQLQQDICSVIVRKLNVNLPGQDTPYHKLGNWIRSIDRRSAIEIFTTNYDLLMEQALDDLEIPYFDGFTGSRRAFFDLRAVEDNLIPAHWTRLWKIHGSINWYQESDEKHKRVYRSSDVKTDASHLIYPSHLKYEESRKMPYLALIDQLNRFLRKKSALLILSGYSFNDGHLNDAIVNALKSNPTAMALGLMFGNFETEATDSEVVLERYPEAYRLAKNQHNLNIWTFDRAIIGTNIGNWMVPTNPQEEADGDLRQFISTSGSDSNSNIRQIKMGDFAIFADFLKTIIGSRDESNE